LVPNALALVELICENPVVTTRSIEDRLGSADRRRYDGLGGWKERGVLTEGETGARGQRRYVARGMMDAVAGDARVW
jgi:hypothetical protein